VRLCTASKQHLDGSVDSRALAPPVLTAASVALIYTHAGHAACFGSGLLSSVRFV